jgi:hypothetical protein
MAQIASSSVRPACRIVIVRFSNSVEREPSGERGTLG